MDQSPKAEFVCTNPKHRFTSQTLFYIDTRFHPLFIPIFNISTPISTEPDRLAALQNIQEKLIETPKEVQEN